MSIKRSVLPALLLLMFLSSATAVSVNKCLPFFTKELVSFNLVPLDADLKDGTYTVQLSPHMNPTTSKLTVDSKIVFKVCGISTKPAGCPDVPVGAFSYYFADGVCFPQVIATTSQINEVIMVNSKTNGVVLGYSNKPGDSTRTTPPDLKFKITCNKDKTGTAQWTPSLTLDGNFVVLSTEHAAGCPTALEDILEIVKMYKWFFALGFIVIGVIFAFFGRNAYKWTLLLTGFILGFLIVSIFCYSFGLLTNATDGTKYTILGISLLVGLLVGFILFKMESVTIAIVCGVLSSLIFMAVMSTFFANNSLEKWVLLLLNIGVGIIGGILGIYFKE